MSLRGKPVVDVCKRPITLEQWPEGADRMTDSARIRRRTHRHLLELSSLDLAAAVGSAFRSKLGICDDSDQSLLNSPMLGMPCLKMKPLLNHAWRPLAGQFAASILPLGSRRAGRAVSMIPAGHRQGGTLRLVGAERRDPSGPRRWTSARCGCGQPQGARRRFGRAARLPWTGGTRRRQAHMPARARRRAHGVGKGAFSVGSRGRDRALRLRRRVALRPGLR